MDIDDPILAKKALEKTIENLMKKQAKSLFTRLGFKYKKGKKKDPAASYLRRGKPNYCRRESA